MYQKRGGKNKKTTYLLLLAPEKDMNISLIRKGNLWSIGCRVAPFLVSPAPLNTQVFSGYSHLKNQSVCTLNLPYFNTSCMYGYSGFILFGSKIWDHLIFWAEKGLCDGKFKAQPAQIVVIDSA